MIKKESETSCVQRWSCSVSSKDGAKAQKRTESKQEEEVVRRRTAKWRLRRKQTARKNWVSERSTYRDCCETFINLRTWNWCSGTGRKKEEEDRTSAGAPEVAEEVSEAAEFAGQEGELPFRRCLRSRAIVERKQMCWKKKFSPCKQERKEEAALRDSPMDVACSSHCP